MSITKQNIFDAYARTDQHPADKRVRLTSDENDVIALHYPGVKAIIYERSMPTEITALLNSGQCREKAYMRPQTRVNDANQIEILNWDKKTPTALQKDSIFLLQIFQNAVQKNIVRNEILPKIYKQSISGDFNYRALAENTTNTVRPHVDGIAVNVRALASYTLDSDLGTVWFPGDLSKADINNIDVEMQKNYDQASKKYNMQTVPLGHILLMKATGYVSPLGLSGNALTSPVDPVELLVHSKPMPKKGRERYTNIYP